MLTDARTNTLRMVRLLAALAACAFVWLALLTFDRCDWPSTAAWPPNLPVNNAGGRLGAWLAYTLLHYVGAAAFPLITFATALVVVRMSRREINELPLRVTGLALFVAATAASVSLLLPVSADDLPEGRGGVLGVVVLWGLRSRLSNAGTAILLMCTLLVGLLLAADDVLLRLPHAARRLRAHLATVPLFGRWLGGGVLAAATPARLDVTPRRRSLSDEPIVRRGIAPVPTDLVAGALGRPAERPPAAEAAPAAPPEPVPEARPTETRPADDPVRELVVRTLASKPQKPAAANPWPKELGDYLLPPLSLLGDPEYSRMAANEHVVREKARILEKALQEFRIDARVVEIDSGPVITLFEVDLAPGIKVGQISALSNDIARALKAPVVRVVPTLPGKNTIGIEVPNLDKEKVRLKELVTLGGVRPTKMAVPVFLGKDASGNPLIADVADMPHLLIAGTTGSGKSVCINSLIMSILMTQRPDHVKLILIDPKMVELSAFKDVPHLMSPIVTDMKQAELILDWAATKMDERYELLAEAGVKNIAAFNRLGRDEIYKRFDPTTDEERARIPTHLPYIVLIIDELADLMMTSGKEVEHHLARLAQKSRAVGIHLIVATQRPQANVVTGLIKSNLPCRIAFRVASRMDSRIVLDQNGAELLMGQGDMLYLPPGSSKLLRSQGTFIEDEELRAVIDDLRGKASPEFHHELVKLRPQADDNSGERDPLFDDAVDIIVETRRGSVSLLQRRLEIGYSRASRLIDQMAAAGIVGEYKGSQAREVALTKDEWEVIKKQRNAEIATGNWAADRDDEPAEDDLTVPDLLDEAADLRG